MKNTLNKTKLAFTSILLASAFTAQADLAIVDKAKIISNLNNIEVPIASSVKTIEQNFRTNGVGGSTSIDLLAGAGVNPYISTMTYDGASFILTLTFASSGSSVTAETDSVASGAETVVSTAVDKRLAGKKIWLVPIFNSNDANITAWECVTDVGSTANFMGGNTSSPAAGEPSVLSELSDSPYLSNCVFGNVAG